MYLCERHFGDNGEHDLLALGWVRILLVLIEPSLERGGGLACGVFAPRSQIVAASVPKISLLSIKCEILTLKTFMNIFK